jgi:hypothetical protein
MFSTWGSTQDVGWVRYAFDHFELPYDLIYKERMRKGNLRAAYDVIVIPSQGRGAPRAGVRYRVEGQAAGLQQDAGVSDVWACTANRKTSGRHGARGRGGAGEVRESRRRADHARARPASSRRTSASRRRWRRRAPRPQFYARARWWRWNPAAVASRFSTATDKVVPVRYANGPLLRVPQEPMRSKWVLAQFPGNGETSVLSATNP